MERGEQKNRQRTWTQVVRPWKVPWLVSVAPSSTKLRTEYLSVSSQMRFACYVVCCEAGI